MKTYDKSRGWLVKCAGGPLDGVFVRSWCLKGEPAAEADALPPTMEVMTIHGPESERCIDTRGEYRLVVTEKMATCKGAKIPAREWQWTET